MEENKKELEQSEKDYDLFEEKVVNVEKDIKDSEGKDNFEKEKAEFFKLRESLKNAKDQVVKQQGLAYKFGIKKKNPASDKEYAKIEDEYKKMVESLKAKGLKVEDIIKQSKEGGSVEKAEAYISQKEKEVQAKAEQLPPQKRELFNKLKRLAKDRRVQLLVGAALVGIAITCPPAAVLTGGAIQGFIPYAFAPVAKGLTAAAGGFMMRGILKKREEKKQESAKEEPKPEIIPEPAPEATPEPEPKEPAPEATPEATPEPAPRSVPEPKETENYDLGGDIPAHLAGRFGNIEETERKEQEQKIGEELAGRFGNTEELIRKKQEFEERRKIEEEIATEMPSGPEIPTPEEAEIKYNELEEQRKIEEEIATEMPSGPEIPTPEEAAAKFSKIKETDEDEEDKKKEMFN